ncbi:hypothetical protein DFH06DRAFT_1144937 [Mycena polygramma]|nr:hypothetical protein DFH06DRAFT_1144937 [Mycena polygramma]
MRITTALLVVAFTGTKILLVASTTHSPVVITSLPPANYLSTHQEHAVKSPLRNRAAIPECLKTVELSCLNLAANCIDTVTFDTIHTLWAIRACVAAATCYGVYAPIVGSCAFASGGCPITQQNYIDFYYGQLSAINSANFPAISYHDSVGESCSSSAIVVAFWQAMTIWAATGSSVPYLKQVPSFFCVQSLIRRASFNDWLHFSSVQSVTTADTGPPPASFTAVDWSKFPSSIDAAKNHYLHPDPNPAPPSGAVSETFVKASTTVILAIPTTTTTVVVDDITITLAPDNNVFPPVSASTVTFTAPPSFTSVVAVPAASNSPPQNITGPPGDKNKDGDDWWLLLFGGLIGGFMPIDIGIPGGITPTAYPPDGWTGEWTDPSPSSTSSSSDSQSASSTSSSTSCSKPTGVYDLSDDDDNADWESEGTDPDRKRAERTSPRTFSVAGCAATIANNMAVNLGAGVYYSIGLKSNPSISITLSSTNVTRRPDGNGGGTARLSRRHDGSCVDQSRGQGKHFSGHGGNHSLADWTTNMVWVDKPLNQGNHSLFYVGAAVFLLFNNRTAKSNVVNGNSDDPNNPPQKKNMDKITDVNNPGASADLIDNMEYFARHAGALGQCEAFGSLYFQLTADMFRGTALSVQNLLAEITPDTPDIALPAAFNEWLRELIKKYPNGCTSRATNVFDYYKDKMNDVSAAQMTTVPSCFLLFHSVVFNPSTFNDASLIPPAPMLPGCDAPGTKGSFSVDADNSGPVIINGVKIMGSGNTINYALGGLASKYRRRDGRGSILTFAVLAFRSGDAGTWKWTFGEVQHAKFSPNMRMIPCSANYAARVQPSQATLREKNDLRFYKSDAGICRVPLSAEVA